MAVTRLIISGKDCREALLKGVETLANVVGSTLGPSGKAVTIATRQQNGYYWPHTTKDGARVAGAIVIEDALLSVGANMVKQAAGETAQVAGDGTTSSIVLAEALVRGGFKLIEAGANPHEVKAGMEAACEKVCEYLKNMAIPVIGNMIRHVAIVSANGDEVLGNIVADAYEAVNENGVVTLEKATGNKTRIESVKGMIVPAGTSEFYVTDYRNRRCDLQNPVVAITTEVISNLKDLEKVVEYCTQQKRPLLLFADNVIGEAQALLLGNKGKFPSCVVPIPEHLKSSSDLLTDLAVVTGAKVLGKQFGTLLSKSNFHHYGSAGKCEIYTNRSVIVGGSGSEEAITERTDYIKKQIEEAGSNEEERDALQQRLSGIDGGVSVIHVGAETEAEFSELYDRYDDAVKAVRGAKTSGILPGGGVALIRVANTYHGNHLYGERYKGGEAVVFRSLTATLYKIMENAGISSEVKKEKATRWENILVFLKLKKRKLIGIDSFSDANKIFYNIHRSSEVEQVNKSILGTKEDMIKSSQFGYNFRTNQYGDMIEMGIIDPAIVTITALQKAVSVAGSILVTDNILVNS